MADMPNVDAAIGKLAAAIEKLGPLAYEGVLRAVRIDGITNLATAGAWLIFAGLVARWVWRNRERLLDETLLDSFPHFACLMVVSLGGLIITIAAFIGIFTPRFWISALDPQAALLLRIIN